MAYQSPITATMPCRECDREISAVARECPHCGAQQFETGKAVTRTDVPSERRALTTVLLALLLGVFGAHRFYVGKIGTGLLQLVTIGGLGLWWLFDVILIFTGQFRDKEGHRVTEWM
jgi:hypothetical protein